MPTAYTRKHTSITGQPRCLQRSVPRARACAKRRICSDRLWAEEEIIGQIGKSRRMQTSGKINGWKRVKATGKRVEAHGNYEWNKEDICLVIGW